MQSIRMSSAASPPVVFVGLLSVLLQTDPVSRRASPDLPTVSRGRPATSAALNVFLYHDAAVSEHGAGHVGEEGPGVGGGLVGLHVAQRRPLTADDAPRRVDLAIEHHGTAGGEAGRASAMELPRGPGDRASHPVCGRCCCPFAKATWALAALLCPLTSAV